MSDEEVFLVGAQDSNSKPRFKVCLNGTNIRINADSCSTCNLIDRKTFSSLRVKPLLQPTSVHVVAYGGEKVELAGMFMGTLEWKGQQVTDRFYVVPSGQTPILNLQNSQALGMIKVANDEGDKVYSVDNSSDPYWFMENHPELWAGVGKLKGYQVKLHVDSSVMPVAIPHRRVPFHVRKKLEAVLERLETEDIIEQVSDPTPWVSPIVVVSKPKNPEEIRMCVDMRCPNTAILRERHITPTVNDIQNA